MRYSFLNLLLFESVENDRKQLQSSREKKAVSSSLKYISIRLHLGDRKNDEVWFPDLRGQFSITEKDCIRHFVLGTWRSLRLLDNRRSPSRCLGKRVSWKAVSRSRIFRVLTSRPETETDNQFLYRLREFSYYHDFSTVNMCSTKTWVGLVLKNWRIPSTEFGVSHM